MTGPDVSVVTATYDAADHVERALASVRRQTADSGRVEHVVVDDGSTDGTTEVVAGFDTPGLRLVDTGTNSGPWRTMNRGIEAARGAYVVFLDADDAFCPELVERLAGVLDRSPEVDFVHCDYYEQTPDGERVVVETGGDLGETVTVGVMHRATHLDRLGGFDPGTIHAEYDLLLRYREAGLVGHHVAEPLFVYHRRDDSRSADGERVAEGVAQLRERYGGDLEIREY